MTSYWTSLRRTVRMRILNTQEQPVPSAVTDKVYGRRKVTADLSSGYSGTIFGDRLFTGISGN